MSIECAECERDLRGGHDETCSRHPDSRKRVSVFKIRNGKGLYSTGGHDPDFTLAGKSWSKFSQVKAHLTNYAHAYYGRARAVPEDWVIVEFEEVRTLGRAKDIRDVKRRAP